jgi:hypothetical protein
MKITKSILGVSIILSIGFAQVCCSLVGSVNSNSSVNSWETQWPSLLDFNRKPNWIIGSTFGKPYNVGQNIQYGFINTTFTEFSNYIFPKTVGFIDGSLNISNISENISFEQSETYINQLNLDLGFRYLISHKWGHLNGILHLPLNTKYSNDDFLFKTKAVSSISGTWIKPFLISTSTINRRLSLQLSVSKNLKEDPQVYIDDNYNLNVSTSFNVFSNLSISPNINTNYYKLLAPLSPYDSERQERWLEIIAAGFDITPINKLNWLHFGGSIPLIFWASEIGFPDGTQPTPSFSITMVRKINK